METEQRSMQPLVHIMTITIETAKGAKYFAAATTRGGKQEPRRADNLSPDLIRICPLTVQKISLSIAAVREICAFKVADLTHGSNPRAVTGTRAHDCARLLDEHLVYVSRGQAGLTPLLPQPHVHA